MIKLLKHIYHLYKLKVRNKGVRLSLLNGNGGGNRLQVNVDKSIIQKCVFSFCGNNNTVEIEDGCILTGVWFFLGGDNNTIKIGANTYSNADSRRLNLFSVAHGTSLTIGESCLFASDIEIQTTDHHKIIVDGKQTNLSKDVVIGNHCWIAAHTRLLKGIHVADNTVIGANSVVVKDVLDSNCVIVGNPAKVVKHNINWDY